MRRRLLLLTALLVSVALPSKPDPAVSASGFKLPYPGGATYLVSQGNNSGSHTGYGAYAWDFAMPYGATVVASRAGVVRFTQASYGIGDCDSSYAGAANYVVIDHGDGLSSLYLHLKENGVLVRPGQYVEQGQPIGYSDTSGWSCGAHLHFQVQRTSDSWWSQSVPVTFDDVPGGQLEVGKSYTSGNYPSPGLQLSSSTTISPPQPVVGQQVSVAFSIFNPTQRTVSISHLIIYGTGPASSWQVDAGARDMPPGTTWDVLMPLPSARTMGWGDIGGWRLQGIRAILSDGSMVDIAAAGYALARSFRVGPLEGSLIKGSDDAVYYVMGGRRRHIPDLETFNALGFRWQDVHILSDIALASVPGGSRLPSVRSGWVGIYYATSDFSGLPELIRRDSRISFDWKLNSPSGSLPADGFSARWARLKYFKEGTYTFSILADDYGILYLDGKELVRSNSAPRRYWMGYISEGYHLIKVDFSDNSGPAKVQQTLVPGDGIPPSGSLSASPLPATQVITVSLSFSAQDNVTPPDNILYRVGTGRPRSGISWSRWFSMTSAREWRLLNGPDGTQTVIYTQYRDSARNLSDRSAVTVTLVRGVPTVYQPTEGATLSLPSSFSWSSVPDASRYQVQVEQFTNEGWKSYRTYYTADTTLDVTSGLAPGQYRWRVRALVYGYWGGFSPWNSFTIR